MDGILDFFRPPVWSVTELTRYVRELLESDANLADVWVQGEVSNVSHPRSGHLYFTLKDDKAQLSVVMWKPRVLRQGFIPEDGQLVEVHGQVSVYEAGGRYQLYADVIRPLGEGALYRAFLRLKARLEAEGLFDEARKRPLPRFPRRIGVVTSPTGAALRDILNTLRRRYPLAEVILAPTAVQGDEAPQGIVAALEALNRWVQPDVILLARGGGSAEDLHAFNDEAVVRAVAASPAPVVTGVGHQTDFTLVDFAADLRAPTPTGAAELATPNRADLRHDLTRLARRLQQTMTVRLTRARWRLAEVEHRLSRRTPFVRVQLDRQRLDDLAWRLERAMQGQTQAQRQRLHYLRIRLLAHDPRRALRLRRAHQQALARRLQLAMQHHLRLHRLAWQGYARRLESLSPLAVLRRGYAIVRDEHGRVLRHAGRVTPGQRLEVLLAHGRLWSRVEQVEPPADEITDAPDETPPAP